MKDPVITHRKVADKIKLEGQYYFTANVTIGLADGGDFYLEIDFTNLIESDLKILAELSKLQRELKINSDLIEKEKFNISHIIITSFNATRNIEMSWKCLSDDPDLYESLDVK